MATVKFYSDKAKQNQVYPDINPDGDYPGVTVGLANNLVSPDGVDDKDTFNYRSTGGSQDISDGYADLRNLVGSMTSTTIEEKLNWNLLTTGVSAITVNKTTFKSKISQTGTYNFIYLPTINYTSALVYSLNETVFANYTSMTTGTYKFTYTPIIAYVDASSIISTFTQSTFITKVDEKPGTYNFTYDGSNWKLDETTVTLSQYGIVTKGTELTGASITIYYTSNSWYYNNAAVSLSNYGITTTGNEKVGDEISISYASNDWQLNSNKVTLSQYGISITTGAAAINDNIQIVFVAEEIGVIVVSKPTSLYSVGLNQFNVEGNQIFTGYTIDTTGKVVQSSNSYVIYFKCLGGNTYTIYNSTASSTKRVAYSANVPTTSSTGLTVLSTVNTATSGQAVTNNSNKSYYTPSSNGYLCVATTNIENLCCHLTWSGYNDEVYETYWDYSLPINYTDKSGSVITEYGLAKIDATYFDEIDYTTNKFYKRTDRVAYSESNLADVQSRTTHYLYDSNWIYFGISTVTYDLPVISYSYQVSDFGTEQFIGTDLQLSTNIFYQQNLKDKLRRSVEVVDNKVNSVNSSSTTDEYPSAKCVYDLDQALRKILGLNVDTFSTSKTYAVGDYVVYQLKLWKCTTAVTSAGSWKSANWTESYLFKAS